MNPSDIAADVCRVVAVRATHSEKGDVREALVTASVLRACRRKQSPTRVRSVRELTNMRTIVAVGVATAAMTVVLVAFMLGTHTEFQVKRAVELAADVSELGEPVQVFGHDFKWLRGWTCDECEVLKRALQSGDLVLTCGGGVARLFYVRVGSDNRVRSYAACGS